MDGLYSALIIEADEPSLARWRLFEYSRSQKVAGTNVIATSAHTNMPRSSSVGLPMGWEVHTARWRALTNIRFAEHVLDWAAQTSVQFWNNDRSVDTRPLLDLLFAPNYFGANSTTWSPAWLRENMSFYVELMSTEAATDKLRQWLLEHSIDGKLILRIFLEGAFTRVPF